MDREEIKAIPIDLDRPTEHDAKVVYAIPAKPKPKLAWWKRKFGTILLIIYALGMMVYLYGSE